MVAAEAAGKLTFAGRVCNPECVRELLTRLFENDDDNIGVDDNDRIPTQVRNPLRLRQLLALFLPALVEIGELANRLVEYVCSVLNKGRCNEKTPRRKALPNNKDAVLTALGVILDTLYENIDVICKT